MQSGKFAIGEWTVDPTTNTICRVGSESTLPPRLIDMLIFFSQHPKEVISREELVNSLWNRTAVTDQAVTQTIFELRKALRDGRKTGQVPEYIQTVPKRGYRLLAPVQQFETVGSANTASTTAIKSAEPMAPTTAEAPKQSVHKSSEAAPEVNEETSEVEEDQNSTSKFVSLVKNLWLDPSSLGFKKTPY